MRLIPWERTQKGDPHKLFQAVFGVKKGVPNGPVIGHKSLAYCFFPVLIEDFPEEGGFGRAIGKPKIETRKALRFHTGMSKVITDRLFFFWEQAAPITDTESCREKN